MPSLTALIAFREPVARQALAVTLAAAEYRVVECGDHAEALGLAATAGPDLVLVELGPPLIAGLELVHRLRLRSDVAIVALGPPDDEGAAVRALDVGADDCLTATASPDLLLAHVRAVLRRLRATEAERRPVLVAGELTVDFDRRRLFRRGQEVVLRPTEWQLLAELAGSVGHVLPHEELLTRAWGPEYRHDRSYLRVGIRRLRRALADDAEAPRYVHTVPGRGYLFEPSPP